MVEQDDINYILTKAATELKALRGKKILLTGAGGFLGYYFTKSFLALNDKFPCNPIHLTIISTFGSGFPKWLELYKNRKDLKIIKADFSIYSLSKLKKDHFDYIIHAASIASPTFYRLDPIKTINANIQGLYVLLNYMVEMKKKYPVKDLLFFSSSEIYGDPLPGNIPTPETYRGNVSCTGPRACYDESKRFGETLCVNYAQVYDLPIKIARPFNNYGPGMKITDGRVIADFSKNIIEQKNIVMFSDGTPSRTFCYVTYAIVWYLKILINGKQGESYNIGVEKPEISIKELAYKMVDIGKKHLGYKGNVLFKKSEDKQYLKDNPQRRCPVITKARTHIGYNPEESLETGLLKTMQWYFDNYSK